MLDLFIFIFILNYEFFGRFEDVSNCLNYFIMYYEDLRG